MLGKQLFEPMTVKTWGVVSFEQIPEGAIQNFVLALAHAMVAVGMSTQVHCLDYLANVLIRDECVTCLVVFVFPINIATGVASPKPPIMMASPYNVEQVYALLASVFLLYLPCNRS